MTTDTFVGRERQLAQLDAFLERAVAGRGQVCFITGDAGAGKTMLGAEFLRRAEAQQKDLVAAVAMGDPQTGASDPYLIFREVLAMLTGDVDSRLAQGAITKEGAQRLQGAVRTSIDCLVEFGPDLIGLLVPGANLAVQVAKIGIETSKRAGLMEKLTAAPAAARSDIPGQKGIDQGQIFEQYAKVLKALSHHAPLLLILDDLQWADNSSTDLLFHLARRIESSRIFIVGMYRPAEIALGRDGQRHPLERVVTEIKRYYGDVIIDLDAAAYAEGSAFIDAMLDTEPNRLGPGFRQALLERTGGNPLFVVELLRDMEEQGDTVVDEQGRWVESPRLDWSALPARAEGVIESRISRLTGDLLEALKLASVQGDAFTAEVVAKIRELNTRDFVRQLSSELEKRHRLVSAQGQQRVGEQRLSQYQFQNRLFQQYLYTALDPTERAYLHEDIGRALEALYGERADEVAARLAWHFEQAGVSDKARPYLRRAGEQAAERFAHAEAAGYFTRALAITPADALEERFALTLGRVKALDRLGKREAQTQDAMELERLAEALDEAHKRAEAALQSAYCEEAKHDYAAAAAACQTALAWARAAGDIERELEARLQWSWVLYRQGQYADVYEQATQIRAQAQDAGLRQWLASSLRLLGVIEQEQGALDDAETHLQQALQAYRELHDPRGEGKTAGNLGTNSRGQGRFAEAERWDELALASYREVGDRRNEATTLNNMGVLMISTGDVSGARGLFEQVHAIASEAGERLSEGAALVNLSSICRMQGDYAQALLYAEQALPIFEAINSPYGKSHAWLRIGHALAGLQRLDEAAAAYQNAIVLHQQLGNEKLGMESQAGLARVRLAQGDRAQALADLQVVLDLLAADGDFEGTEEPLWIYLTCYQVLQANDDPRAEEHLAEAHRRLQDQAAKFGDETARRMFLANIPEHRAIVKAVTGVDPELTLVSPMAPPPTELPSPTPTEPTPATSAAAEATPDSFKLAAPPTPTVEFEPPVAPAESVGPAPTGQTNRFKSLTAFRIPTFTRALVLRIIAALATVAVVLILLTQIPALFSPDACPPACAGQELARRDWQDDDLVGVDLSGANLYAARLTSADLTGSVLISATLTAADLSSTSLRGADLRQANLRGATLTGADLTSADLRGAILVGADLSNADLTDTDLAGANLAAARLDGAVFTDTRHDAATRWPHGFVPPRID